MASNTQKSEHRRATKHKNAGRKRKNKESRHSTPSMAELFAACGEPGKPAPAARARS